VSVQAANDTNNDQDRANLQAEMSAMVTEIDRIASTTTWAGENLMQASGGSSFSFQVGAATGTPNQISVAIDGMGAKNLGIAASTEAERSANTVALAAHAALETAHTNAIAATATAFDAKVVADAAVVTSQAKDVLVAAVSLQTVTGTTTTASTDGEKAAAVRDGLAAGLAGVADGMDAGAASARLVAAGMSDAGEKTAGLALVDLLDTAIANFKATTTDADAATKYGLVVTAMDNVQLATETNSGAALVNEADVVAIGAAFTDMVSKAATYTGSGTAPVDTLAFQATAVAKAAALVTAENDEATANANLNASNHPANLSGSNLSVTSSTNALTSIATIDTAIQTVNIQRSELGAVSNRLNHTVNNLTNISSNLSAAKGGIEDADFALETTNLAKNQILQQASTAMLAQANASKQNVLSLLQG
jgi:flagellin